MKKTIVRAALFALCSILVFPAGSKAGQYTNFDVSIYIPVSIVRNLDDPETLSNQWNRISSQLKVDKVYIEVQRDRNVASGETLERVKKFFMDRGLQVAGGMAASDGSIGGQFKTFCYTDPADRAFIQSAAELAARHFDELIQDDFFFNTTKYDSDIAAKGDKSWTQFRLDLMDDVAENLIIKPAKAINPKMKLVIKFPNWYEHFQGLGYDLDKEPKLFDGIYTGTETRDPEITDQNLQQYESYQIIRYFDNIAPGRNGGGWVDTFSIRYIDRYAEQLWDTVFAKAPEMMLFEWSGMLRSIQPARAQTGKTCTRVLTTTRCCRRGRPTRPLVPSRQSRASRATRWNRRIHFSASSASRSELPATNRINPPARIFSTIISAISEFPLTCILNFRRTRIWFC
jgi:hypothetical protein